MKQEPRGGGTMGRGLRWTEYTRKGEVTTEGPRRRGWNEDRKGKFDCFCASLLLSSRKKETERQTVKEEERRKKQEEEKASKPFSPLCSLVRIYPIFTNASKHHLAS